MDVLAGQIEALIGSVTSILILVVSGVILWGFFRIFIKYKTATNEQEKKQAKHEAFEELKTIVLFLIIGTAIVLIWNQFSGNII